MNDLLEKLRHNFILKLLSVVIAIVIWYVVVGTNDPIITKSYSVHINVLNDAYIANGKQSYTIDESYKSIMVYIKGNRSTLRNISESDIVVNADLTQIVDMSQDPVYVPLTATCPGIEQSNITLARTTVPITISSIESKEFPVTVSCGNTSPGKEFEVGKTTPSVQKVVISGPNERINAIDSVVASIDVSGMEESKSVKATLKLYDKNQAEISQSVVEDDLTFEGGTPSITVHVELWKKQSDVNCEIECQGDPAYGYRVDEIYTVPETITIAGTDDALKQLSEDGNAIIIPVDVSGAEETLMGEIDISEYLPENTKLAENTASTVTFNVSILPINSQTISLDVESIEQKNLTKGLVVSYDTATISVVVCKENDDEKMEDGELTADDLKATIDFDGMSEGDYSQTVNVELPDGYSLVETPNITLHIKKAA